MRTLLAQNVTVPRHHVRHHHADTTAHRTMYVTQKKWVNQEQKIGQ
jgi:hypothetical protein